MALPGLVFMPDYMDLCNGGVACQGRESSSVWLTDSRFAWAAKSAAGKKQRTTGPIESLGLLSTKCHRSRQPCHENIDEKGLQNIPPMPGVLEMQKKRARAGWDTKLSNLRQWSRATWWVFSPRPSVRAKNWIWFHYHVSIAAFHPKKMLH